MGFASLGSGSRGNGTLVFLGEKLFLVDCGFSLKQAEKRLARLGVSGGDIDGIFVTHEHADHISGVVPFSHKYKIPIYASFGTAKSLGKGGDLRCFDGDKKFELEGIWVNPVIVPHDAREATQFTFSFKDECVGVLSDLGFVTDHVIEQFGPFNQLLLEANHDEDILVKGAYPQRLKNRIRSDYGHLSNNQSFAALQQFAHRNLEVVIGHVSEQNNSNEQLEAVFEPIRAELKGLYYATQKEGFDWVCERPVVRQTQMGLGG